MTIHMQRIMLAALAIASAGCTLVGAPDPDSEAGIACLLAPYKPPIGLAVNGRGRVTDAARATGLQVWRAPGRQYDASPIGLLQRGETFVVLGGPVCFQHPSEIVGQATFRQWRVRSESRDLEGWVGEYVYNIYSTDPAYYLEPIAGGDR